MREWILNIRNKGITEATTRVEEKRIRLLNDIMLIFLIFQTLAYFDYIARGSWTQIPLQFAGQIVVIVPIILNAYQKIQTARWFFIFNTTLVALAIKMSHGSEVQIAQFYIMAGVTGTYFFDNKWRRIFVVILILSAYTFGEYYVRNYPAPLAYVVGPEFNFLFFAAITICTIIIVAFFVDDNNKFEAQMSKLLNELQTKNKNLETNQAKIEQQNKELERFTYIASHDLKTPLRSINSFLGLLNRQLSDHSDKDVHEYLNYAKNSAQQMHILVEDILEYSKLGQEQVDYSTVELSKVIQIALKNLKQLITKRRAEIHIQALPSILGNSPRLVIVLQNLIENGIVYNQNEIPIIRVNHKIENEKHQIIIRDNGIGIAQEHHERIFEMFKRLHTQVKYQGSGIGLSICKKIISQHQGRIWIESEENYGTTFFIELPKRLEFS